MGGKSGEGKLEERNRVENVRAYLVPGAFSSFMKNGKWKMNYFSN